MLCEVCIQLTGLTAGGISCFVISQVWNHLNMYCTWDWSHENRAIGNSGNGNQKRKVEMENENGQII